MLPMELGRKIMVVADPTRESTAALQYALAHALTDHDELILLHIGNPSPRRRSFSGFLKSRSLPSFPWNNSNVDGGGGGAPVDFPEEEGVMTMMSFTPGFRPSSLRAIRNLDFLEQMKRTCEIDRPKIRVTIERAVTESDKATTILHRSEVFGVDLIVIGQHRRFSSGLLGYQRIGGSPKLKDTADYLILNSKCSCVGIHKKGLNKGYFLNSKNHKNFWVLA